MLLLLPWWWWPCGSNADFTVAPECLGPHYEVNTYSDTKPPHLRCIVPIVNQRELLYDLQSPSIPTIQPAELPIVVPGRRGNHFLYARCRPHAACKQQEKRAAAACRVDNEKREQADLSESASSPFRQECPVCTSEGGLQEGRANLPVKLNPPDLNVSQFHHRHFFRARSEATLR